MARRNARTAAAAALLLTQRLCAAQDAATATVSTSAPLHALDPAFLGVNVDSASFTNKIDIADAYLTQMAVQLSAAAGGGAPMHLRIGGSASNGLVYIPNGVPGRGGSGITVIFTDSSLKALNDFAIRANARLTFNLPYQTRNGKWDPAINATALWKYVASANLTAFSGWSLGNEIIGKGGFNVAQYAEDYIAFRAAVTSTAPSWAQDIVGPSAAGWPGVPDMQTFLTANAATPRMSISIHAYSFGTCSVETYMSKQGIERMAYYYSEFTQVRNQYSPNLPVYLEEMATQAGGGCNGLSNRYVAGFWFIHSLALAGEFNVSRVTRQDLAGWSFTSGVSNYTLCGPPGWVDAKSNGLPTPHPDWFTAVLWRQLVGSTVLSVSTATTPKVNSTLAVHAWCSNKMVAPAGSVTLVYINVASTPVSLALGGGLATLPRTEFIMTAPGGDLTADGALLNGVLLSVDGAGKLPAQPIPGVAGAGTLITLPSESYGYIVLPGAGAAACA